PKPADLAGRVDGYAAILVEVAGEKDGHSIVHTIYAMLGHREAAQRFGATATAYLTGTGAAAGALLLASGSIREKGKLSPENLDPKPFFPLLRTFGIDVKERVRSERSLAWRECLRHAVSIPWRALSGSGSSIVSGGWIRCRV